MRKYVKFIVLGVSVVVIGLYMSTTYKPRVTEVDPVVAREENSFDQKLDEYNVTVQGSSSYLSRFQLKGFINMMDSSDLHTIQKYTQKLEEAEDKIELTACEILELHYYSTSKDEQMNFLGDISNRAVDISGDGNGTLLISYNN